MNPALIPWALSGGAAVAVGFARFGYALILPAMKTDLELNYAQAGWLNTANALGYLLGALLTIYFVARIGNRRLFVAGLALTTLALLANGLTHDFQRSEEHTSELQSLMRISYAVFCLKK